MKIISQGTKPEPVKPAWRIVRFAKAVYDDICPSPKEWMMIVIASVLFTVPAVGIIALIGWGISSSMGKPFDGNSMEAATALLMILFGLVYVVGYFVRKWKESR